MRCLKFRLAMCNHNQIDESIYRNVYKKPKRDHIASLSPQCFVLRLMLANLQFSFLIHINMLRENI